MRIKRNKKLTDLSVGGRGIVQSAEALDVQSAPLARRLLELGFVPGAKVEVIATMWPGEDPMAIRVGGSIFALRRHEAGLINLAPAVL
ncbi:MAG: ferrous iron transport protein A [Gammaproteobacteria bacterium]|nr:ferrous iron transport protein A [Gammaproteobacteria bacterium]